MQMLIFTYHVEKLYDGEQRKFFVVREFRMRIGDGEEVHYSYHVCYFMHAYYFIHVSAPLATHYIIEY